MLWRHIGARVSTETLLFVPSINKKIKDPYYWLFVGVSSHKEPVMSIVIPCNDVITQNDIVRYACMDEFGYKSAGGVKKT